MKRWTLVVFLLLVPFTMAPRTSLNPGGGELALTGIISRTEVRPGSAVTFVVQARNVTDTPMARAHVNILVGWDEKSDMLKLRASRICTVTPAHGQLHVSCPLGALDPGEQGTVRVTTRPLVPGVLTFAAEGLGGLAPVPGEQTIEVFVRGRS